MDNWTAIKSELDSGVLNLVANKSPNLETLGLNIMLALDTPYQDQLLDWSIQLTSASDNVQYLYYQTNEWTSDET